MQILFYITLLLLIAYGFLIDYYRRSWNSIPDFVLRSQPLTPQIEKVSVIVPARNEEKNIVSCLQSLLAQDYPQAQFEIIVVDDHSTDQTAALVQSFQHPSIRLIRLADYAEAGETKAFKKKALGIAIAQSSGSWIMTTDADCICPPQWITQMQSIHSQQQASFIAAPVRVMAGRSALSIFQALDFISLQGITGASVYKQFHSMCNGANLGYEKSAFIAVDGFSGIDHIASGDDMFLMHKIRKQFPGRVFFLKSKEAIVNTKPVLSVSAFLQQRIRWASKAAYYDEKSITASLALVFALNFFLLALLMAACWNLYSLGLFFLLLLTKTIIEFPFVSRVADFFDQRHLMKYFLFCQPFHVVYTVIAGVMGRWSGYEWKGRKLT